MKTIRKIGIIGSGKMGSDIFNYLSDFDFNLIWFTRNTDHVDELKRTYQKKIHRQLKHGIISQDVFEFRKMYKITDNFNDVFDCDLIIESIIEDLDAKTELFQKLDEITKPSCILASNTSSILIHEIGQDISGKGRMVGLHFFYPIAFKNIVEINFTDATDEIVKEKCRLFLDDIKRFYIELNSESAFIINRLLLEVQLKATLLLNKFGLGYKQFDSIAKNVITEFGLFEMMDHVGHNTMYAAIMNYSRMGEDKRKYEPLLLEIKNTTINSGYQLFYEREQKQAQIEESVEQQIIEELRKEIIQSLNTYSTFYNIDINALRKGFDELCGIII